MNKIDVEGLRRDLNKFQEHYPEKASSFWSTWVEKIDDLVAVPEEWEWPLDTLQSAEKVRPTPVDRAIPNHLQALQDKETEPTREASQLLQLMYHGIYTCTIWYMLNVRNVQKGF